jgi:hypothetical protein
MLNAIRIGVMCISISLTAMQAKERGMSHPATYYYQLNTTICKLLRNPTFKADKDKGGGVAGSASLGSVY